MTENCFRSITPDSLTGMIFAMEGMRDTIVLLNGPMGCRFYHSSTSGFLMRRPLLYLPVKENGRRVPVDYNYLNDWFFRQDRVPCTYLDGHDYVYGTADKVSEALAYIEKNIDFSLLAVVNSPGAALIGDDILNTAERTVPDKPVVYLESPGYSESFDAGYSLACLSMLERMTGGVRLSACPGKKKVNLLGLSIWHRYCEGDIRELKRLFGMCKTEVAAVPCADCSMEDLKEIPGSDLNIVVYPDAGLASAEYLKEKFGTPYYVCPSLPVGFPATEKIFSDVCGILNAPYKELKEESERARALAWNKLNGIFQMYGKPKGVRFHVAAPDTLARSYSAFLTDYLGMEETDPENAEILLSDGNRISERAVSGDPFCGIEIAFPGMGYTDLTVKTHMGINGALFLTEQILNAVMSK